MRIVFIHYHLKPGGVTQVIQQQAGICKQMGWHYCILSGENELNISNVLVISDLYYNNYHNYDCPSAKQSWIQPDHTDKNKQDSALLLAKQIEQKINSFFQDSRTSHPSADIIHVHNATLAKNVNLLRALHFLQDWGNKLFLQLHDFAEDGRPSVYAATDYPSGVHYGCINNRDKKYLSLSGLPDDLLHSIPNLVSPLPKAPSAEKSMALRPSTKKRQRLALYPVRGIRRKNLGELILLSTLLHDITFGITLEPNSTSDKPSYQFWKQFSSTIGAAVEFNITKRQTFEEVLSEADFFISTSVQEGFGFAFLEPWTLQKNIAGRCIPYVNSDFVGAGMKMDSLYTSIPIPVDNINMNTFQTCWLTESEHRLKCFAVTLRNQGLNSTADKVHDRIGSLRNDFARLYESSPSIDFARLDRENQASVILRVIAKPKLAENIRTSVPQLFACPISNCVHEDLEVVEYNRQCVQEIYGEKQYATRLQVIYEKILNEKSGKNKNNGTINKEILLQAFLDPSNIFLITSM